jgi:hypothetical protein
VRVELRLVQGSRIAKDPVTGRCGPVPIPGPVLGRAEVEPGELADLRGRLASGQVCAVEVPGSTAEDSPATAATGPSPVAPGASAPVEAEAAVPKVRARARRSG